MKEIYKSSLHCYPPDKILNWGPADNKELFKKNCKKYPNNKSLKYYKQNPIEYKFNNYGFRTPDDFNDTDEGNIFLGCSHTLGTGHHLENTWAYKVNKEVGGKFWNLSQGGTGIQTDYRLLLGWKDDLTIKNIFHFTKPHSRFEFFYDNSILNLDWRGSYSKEKYQQEFYIEVLSDIHYSNYNQLVYINAIKGIAQDINCNYYYLTDRIFEEYDEDKDDSVQARELQHYTVAKQNFIYDNFLANIK
jgi:hypothetical protein